MRFRVAQDEVGDSIDILVVGGPTHVFGMTWPSTRKSAAEQAPGELVSRGRGM
ncbi:hypothetical protein [Rhizohabitans arisaemae]|uniref:hypothetical protein n=1 Tax=Rhizohabitans arisaemae TaxID=2720610 RepID=UPI0024B1432B|nr:hypothetical protein [Rhizohabitans arisaemae]